jgi:hypothetical protein
MSRTESVVDLQKEYQDYIIARRVRAIFGGRLEPKPKLSLAQYAQRRLERQKAARELITVKPMTPERLSKVDDLTDELCFGMWRNPREINDFLRAAWRAGGHPMLEHPHEFAALALSPTERDRLPKRGLEIAEFYNACLRVGPAALSPEEMDVAAERVERMARDVPVFVDELVQDENRQAH